MPISPLPLGNAGVAVSGLINFPNPLVDGICSYRPGGGLIDGLRTRDVGNSTDGTRELRVGLTMAYNSSTAKWANWSEGTLQSAITGASTSLSVTAATATEIARLGATGTLVVTGPPVANGTVRQMTATYSGVGATSVTITALGVNEVQTLTFGAAATGGSLRLRVPKTDGTFAITDAITWNTTDATYLAAINTALDAATGVSGGIVATGAAPDTALTFTFSGTGYASNTWSLIEVHTFPTSTTTANVVRTTTGVDGRFIAGSVISQPGFSAPLSFIKTPHLQIPETSGDLVWANIPDGGRVDVTQLVDYPADAAFKLWFKSQLKNANGNMPFSFSDF